MPEVEGQWIQDLNPIFLDSPKWLILFWSAPSRIGAESISSYLKWTTRDLVYDKEGRWTHMPFLTTPTKGTMRKEGVTRQAVSSVSSLLENQDSSSGG